MYQMNILHTQKQKDTSVSDAGDMNRNTLKHSAVDGNKKNVLPPPPWGNCCHRLCFLCTHAPGKE